MNSKLCILVLAAISALPIFASTVDDAIQLSQGGVSDDVIVEWAQRHSVTNLGDTPSDFLRIELKRIPPDDLKKVFRGEAPAQPVAAGTRVEFQDPAIRIERTVCPATATCALAPAGERSLLVAVHATHLEMNGADHPLRAGDVIWLRANAPTAPRLSAGAECLRVVLLYP